MIAGWDRQALLDPISVEHPCGQSLEDVLATLGMLRLFGQPRSPEAAPETQEGEREIEKVKPPPDWHQLQADALDALNRSKDLRLLAYLGTAVLRTDPHHGFQAFTELLTTASSWLERYWPQLYPLIDEDAIARRNALNCFADPMAVVDRVWRWPLVDSRQHGRFSLRDLEVASGRAPAGRNEGQPSEQAVRAAFAEMAGEDLSALEQSVASGAAALHSIDVRMRSEGGPEVAPDFTTLLTHFARLQRVLNEQRALRPDAGVGEPIGAPPESGPATGRGGVDAVGFTGGAITSRQDAVRALDAVAEFFRRNEPSSPVPLFVERAKRLVAKDFLEVLADIAPDALAVARAAGGLKLE